MRWTAPVAAVAAAVLVVVASASATAPGTNGLLVFTAGVGQHSQLFTIRPDGTGLKQVTHFKDGSDSGNADWSPNGDRIAFEHDGPAAHAGVVTMNAEGTDIKSLTPFKLNLYEGGPAYSPDGKWIVLGREVHFEKPGSAMIDPRDYAQIMVERVNGINERGVTPKLLIGRHDANHYGEHSQFSPNGKQIVFVKQSTAGAAIFVINVNGTGTKQITPYRLGVDDREDWSPDGSLILFSNAKNNAKGIWSNAYVVRPDGAGLRKITHESNATRINDKADSWSPDGKQIMLVREIGGRKSLWVMNADGSAMTQLTHGLDVHGGAWGTHP
jgi:TolB protein